MNHKEKQAAAQKVTLIGSAVDLFLGVLKIVTGTLFHSHALVIDGLHSLTDLVTDAFVLIIGRVSNEKPDEQHPYGHGRFETLGTVVLGAILIATGGALLYETISRFYSGDVNQLPSWPVFATAIISILGKEIIFRYSKKVGEDLNSQLLIANAWHSRSDAITTIVVLIGALLTYFGVKYMDAAASVIVSIFIGKVGWDFLFSSIKELVDTSLPDEQITKIKKTILNVPGVISMHDLRSRFHGNKAVLDVNIQVSPLITVSEGHEIASWVMKDLMEGFDDIEDVTVHTDVEDDRVGAYEHAPLELLPLRPTLESLVRDQWEKLEAAPKLTEIQFHYLGGRVLVDLFLVNKDLSKEQSDLLTAALREALADTNWFKDIRIWNSFQ